MRGPAWVFVLVLACSGNKGSAPHSSDTAEAAMVDTAADSGTTPDGGHTISMVASTPLPGLVGVRGSVVDPIHGNSFVMGESATTIRILTSSWVHPSGTYCVGGSFDEEGVCRGGQVWASGRIDSPQRTVQYCMDPARQELHLLKQGGQNTEVIDVGIPGADAYSHLRVSRRTTLPAPLAASGGYTGPCAVLPESGEVAFTSPDQRAIAVLGSEEMPTVLRKALLPFRVGWMGVSGSQIVVAEAEGRRIAVVDMESLESTVSHRFNRSITAMAVDGVNGVAWLVVDAGRLEQFWMNDPTRRYGIDVSGRVAHVVVDPARAVAWTAVESDEGWRLVLVSSAGLLAEVDVEGNVLGLGNPSPSGDVPVFVEGPAGESVRAIVFAAEEASPASPPMHGFLFTTIEEPSNLKMDQDCLGEDNSFERELSLVRNNATALAALDIPVALAISDNFTEKAKECGQTSIFRELADFGFTLGVLIHNRPCYHCTDGSHSSNPDSCTRSNPHWIRVASPSACFPDDPAYCPLGDWACYRDHVSPRIDLVDRNIPGGGAFIVGADRHRMWDFDWVRLYREVERSSVERSGFDLTMFANAWAYDGISATDPRGKNRAPWALADQTTPWKIGDVRHWSVDAPLSDLVYLPGNSTSTIKMAEYSSSGLFMIDFFSTGIPIAYQNNDFDVAWQDLRTAMNHRRAGVVNTWYFHVHDLGLINLRDKDGNALHFDPDGEEGPIEAVPNERLLQDFVDQIDERYVASGEFVWMEPRAIRALISP